MDWKEFLGFIFLFEYKKHPAIQYLTQPLIKITRQELTHQLICYEPETKLEKATLEFSRDFVYRV